MKTTRNGPVANQTGADSSGTNQLLNNLTTIRGLILPKIYQKITKNLPKILLNICFKKKTALQKIANSESTQLPTEQPTTAGVQSRTVRKKIKNYV